MPHLSCGRNSVVEVSKATLKRTAKPVLPDTEVTLICSAWGNNRAFLLQNMPSAAGMVRRWTAKFSKRESPDPGPSKGILKRTLVKLVSTGAVPGA
eukprot:1137740-Pelagomonas_calceolata.AAC.5